MIEQQMFSLNCTYLSYIYIYKQISNLIDGKSRKKILEIKNRLNFNIDFSNVIWTTVMEGFRIYNNTLKLRFGIHIDGKWIQLNYDEIG